MAFVAGLIEPGKQRDAILLRRFDHEVARLLEDDFLRLDRDRSGSCTTASGGWWPSTSPTRSPTSSARRPGSGWR